MQHRIHCNLEITLHSYTVPSGLGMGSLLLLLLLFNRKSSVTVLLVYSLNHPIFYKRIKSFSITGYKAYRADLALQNLGTASGSTHRCTTCMFFIVLSASFNKTSCFCISVSMAGCCHVSDLILIQMNHLVPISAKQKWTITLHYYMGCFNFFGFC